MSGLRVRPPKAMKNAPHRIELTQESFAAGPVFVDRPDCVVLLKEDVWVNFNAVKPPEATPFHLGWFGAIIVRASRVYIDLQGHTIGMADAYRIQQRFFAIIELCNTPLPKGKGGFETEPMSLDDIVVRNGHIETTSHHCIHAVQAGSRWLFEDLDMKGFEVGAISVNAASDLMIRRCTIGYPMRPATTSDEVMVRDLARSCERIGSKTVAAEMRKMLSSMKSAPAASDALIRCIVIMPQFNVGRPKKVEDSKRIKRISVHDITFADIRAAPVEVVGIRGRDGLPLKDVNGNLIAHSDAIAGNKLARTQALVSKDLPVNVRSALMVGPYEGEKVYGFDRRGHDLLQKASLYVRVDGADGVSLSNLICGTVLSTGEHSASVGVMINDCANCSVSSVHIEGVRITDQCVSALSDMRPQSGLYIRETERVSVSSYHYGSSHSCACTLRDVKTATLSKCAFAAPLTSLRASDVRMDVS